VVEDTAAGNDEIAASGDPYQEWFWQGIYIAWIAGVWLVPAMLVGRWAAHSVADDRRSLIFSLVAFTVFWATFPISLLSSMCAESRWVILHGGLFVRIAKSIHHLFIFYFLSALLVAICIPLVPWMVDSESLLPLIVAPVAIALAFVLYARLMGRLAYIVRLSRIRRRKKRTRRASVESSVVTDSWDIPEEANEEQEAVQRGFVQPEDLPALQTPYEGEVVGYNVAFNDIPRPVRRMPQPELEAPMPIEEADDELRRARAEEARKRAAAIEPDRVEMERGKYKRRKLPRHPWIEGIWLFPLKPASAVHLGIVSAGLLFLGFLIRVLKMTFPFQ
jgi:hypothetical protein